MATEGQRVVLITGCSSGIGMGIAVHLARDDNQRYHVNNAGVGLVGPVEGLSMEDMANVFETNFYGAVRMIKEVMPDMKRRRSGHIVVISSVMGLCVGPQVWRLMTCTPRRSSPSRASARVWPSSCSSSTSREFHCSLNTSVCSRPCVHQSVFPRS